jgi:deoxycytidylate deaminase
MDVWIKKARKICKLEHNYNLIAFGLDKRGKLVAFGENSFSKTHPEQKRFAGLAGTAYREFLHAEVACLLKGKGKVYKLIIIRFNKKGQTLLAKPCTTCEIAIKEADVKIVEYTL